MDSLLAKQILNDNKKLWNNIATDFSHTRNYVWEDIRNLADYAKPGMKILDLGCGNGRLYEIFKDKNVNYIGIDISEKLIRLAQTKYPEAQFLVGDGLDLPFKDNSFDVIYSIAVFHHLPSQRLRIQFLKEARRVLKKDGKIILTVWNLWQRKYFKLLVKSSLLKLVAKSKLDWRDLYIPWQNKYQRYHHAFTKKELKKLFTKTGFSIERIQYLKRRKKRTNIIMIGNNS